MAMGEDRDESDGLLNADPLKDIESFVKGDEAIYAQALHQASPRSSTREDRRARGQALQAERYLETVRNAARYGESLAAGLTATRPGRRVVVRRRRGAAHENKKAKKPAARKPAARKKYAPRPRKRKRSARADTLPGFCDSVEVLPAAEPCNEEARRGREGPRFQGRRLSVPLGVELA